MFKHRTSALKLPREIIDKYDKILKTCEHCQKKQVRPARSNISGLRANNFGDLIFVDHAEVKMVEGRYIVLIILDAATSFLAAFPQKTFQAEETLDNFREWMELYQCTPKALCSDMAFTTPEFAEFYRRHNIRPLPTGPATPWPNRAEAAVRLFKAHLSDFLAEVDKDPELRHVTPRHLFRKAAYARNTSLTYGGKTPLELAFGRRPRDILTLENSNPEQLSSTPSAPELNDQKLQKLAMKTYLEARQREDIRKDLASRLMPSDGPFSVGACFFYWQADPNKIKHGVAAGKWIR
jgi:hypothetical protein